VGNGTYGQVFKVISDVLLCVVVSWVILLYIVMYNVNGIQLVQYASMCADVSMNKQTKTLHKLSTARWCPWISCRQKKCTKNSWPWPLTYDLKFSRLVEVVHVHAKFDQAKCSGSWVIMVMEKKNFTAML